MMSFATGGVRDMLDNWVRHVRMLGLPILVAAMDALRGTTTRPLFPEIQLAAGVR